MLAKNHLAFGMATVAICEAGVHFVRPREVELLTGVLGSASAPWLLGLGLAMLAGGAGALLPDLDHESSTATHQLWGGGLANAVLGGGLRRLLGGHRGVTHSVLAIAGVGVLTSLLLGSPVGWSGVFGTRWADVGWALTLGYASHILGDLLTREGVPFWWPWTAKRVGIGARAWRFRTGEPLEFVVTLGYALLAILVLWGRHG